MKSTFDKNAEKFVNLMAQGPVTETLCTALHHPAALCTQKKIVFSPSTHLRFVQSGFILAKAAAPVKKFGSH